MFERPPHWPGPFPTRDANILKSEFEKLGAKTLLEFGPGDSTEWFATLGLDVTTCEHDPHWYDVAVDRFRDTPNVKVLKYENEMPVPPIEGVGRFDVAFVDAPQGYAIKRKRHPGYEDTSRFNTTFYALQHAKVVFLHDASRSLERGTLERLNALGYDFTFKGGMIARIWQPQKQTLSIEPSATSEPCPKAKRRTRTRTRRLATSSQECSPS